MYVEISFIDLLKLVGIPVAGFLIGRWTKQSESVGDHSTRLAVAFEKIDALNNRVAVIERDQATQWKSIDKKQDRNG